MKSTFPMAIVAILALYGPVSAAGQVSAGDPPPPQATAERESWYLDGLPVAFAGRIYYPAGPRVHFIQSEMVRSGDLNGVPLYTRTTIEPYSMIFVPVGAGMMQPYERRRDGELAGTVGSSAPSFPVATSGANASRAPVTAPQAQAPPLLAGPVALDASVAAEPVGTSGTVPYPARTTSARTRTARTVTPPAAAPRSSMRRRGAANGIFLEYAGSRWFSSGSPVPFNPSRFTQTGELRGVPVYADRTVPGAIYVPVVRGEVNGLVAPYAKRPQ